MTFRSFAPGTPEYAAALQLREAVLRLPLGLQFSAALSRRRSHLLPTAPFDGPQLIAVLLLQPLDASTVQMRQVAVNPAQQRGGIGTRLIAFAETLRANMATNLSVRTRAAPPSASTKNSATSPPAWSSSKRPSRTAWSAGGFDREPLLCAQLETGK